ncbi:YkvI family membrane protein [Kroppenstedtia sanguinis]|uniref:YkvI family membrane protein n=1 Tax=Kroppenstedtia sanguinis TaxID=1380684 RepID=UPI0036D252B5
MVLHERWFTASRVGFTYIGTVVGAGFASGQEIMQFFTVSGFKSLFAILLVTVLFSWLGIRMMVIGARLQARSYEEFNNYLFGPGVGRWMNGFVGVILFGVTTAMMSGTGALFQEQLGLSFHFGVIVTSLIAFLVIIKGMEGILNVNALVVPCMFAFTLVVGIQGLSGPGLGQFLAMEPMEGARNWVVSAITYAAFNLAMSQSVLIPMGGEIQDEKTLRLGGILGGVGLGVMLLASNFALALKIPEIFQLEIPIALVISTLGDGMKYFFLAVMWGEIFTTLIGNVYGLAANLENWIPVRINTLMALIFILGYVCSLIGFPVFVGYIYPFFGYCGLLTLLLLTFCKYPAIQR